MPRVTPKSREELSDLEDVFERAEQALGFVPNSFFLMGRRPEMLRAFSRLSREVVGVPGRVPQELKWLIAHIASRAAGCQYCMAHTAGSADKAKTAAEQKIDVVFEYERNDLFSAAERAALTVAQAAGTTPNMVTNSDMDNLKKHFDEDQIVIHMNTIDVDQISINEDGTYNLVFYSKQKLAEKRRSFIHVCTL